MWATYLNYLYIFLVVVISIYGVHSLVLSLLYLKNRKKCVTNPVQPEEWPLVAVQLPLYNEKYVAERIIDAVCAFDYPIDRLVIQVLDDSTDETTERAMQRVAHWQSRGYQIEMYHRDNRDGYKAGALSAAMAHTNAEFVAVFDADFLPSPDFLRRTIPHFIGDPKVGMVQGRWGHLNREYNTVTRAEALFLDGHVIVEQVARSRSGLLINFNGTGGVWRAECIRDSGGWQSDTLSEDIDLSYRAQMRGWKMVFLPDVIVPAEIPPTLTAFKKQQYRWAYGVIGAFQKLLGSIWRSPCLNLGQRIMGTFHLATNLAHPFGLMIFLISLPMALFSPEMPSSLGWISLASSGPSVMFSIAQITGYRGGYKRLVSLPVLILIGVGIAISNTVAVFLSLSGRKIEWLRTPKFRIQSKEDEWQASQYVLQIDGTVWAELFMAGYMAIGLGVAIERAPGMIPLMLLGLLSFGYVSAAGLMDTKRPNKKASAQAKQVEIA